jgi:hypothetical protein
MSKKINPSALLRNSYFPFIICAWMINQNEMTQIKSHSLNFNRLIKKLFLG